MSFSFLGKWASVAAAVVILTACGTTVEQASSLNIQANAVGPFFAGPNSLIADYKVDYNTLYPEMSVTADKVDGVTLNSVTVKLEDEDLDFSSFISASLQFVSSNEAMVSTAILNPIESSAKEITLQTSAEADLSTFFKEETFTVVLDLDFKDDDYRDDMNVTIQMNFNSTLKQ